MLVQTFVRFRMDSDGFEKALLWGKDRFPTREREVRARALCTETGCAAIAFCHESQNRIMHRSRVFSTPHYGARFVTLLAGVGVRASQDGRSVARHVQTPALFDLDVCTVATTHTVE